MAAVDLNLDVAKVINITSRYKDTLKFEALITNSDTTAFDFTNCHALLEIKAKAYTPAIQTLTELDGISLSSGKIQINEPLSEDLIPGRYYWTLQITSPSDIITTWFAGAFIIKLDV